MTDRPILFSAAMVRALLDGRKTQTRRLATSKAMQRVQIGDRLWVREPYFERGHWVRNGLTKLGNQKWKFVGTGERAYGTPDFFARTSRDTAKPDEVKWYARLGRFMPRWASRITLTVTDKRTEQLCDISEADALAEGVPDYTLLPGNKVLLAEASSRLRWPQRNFFQIWNSLHTAPGTTWVDNPDVIALTFTLQQGNIDA